MDKFIVFNGNLYNTRYIVSVVKEKRFETFSIKLHLVNDVETEKFDNENERDVQFDNIMEQFVNN